MVTETNMTSNCYLEMRYVAILRESQAHRLGSRYDAGMNNSSLYLTSSLGWLTTWVHTD